ncbi:MAG: hypothetical protein JGK27_01660 [Microcoleus sp. PH2017_20_SFW_D_A]|nr:hypothetical protein [Microcoleus sp. PH2017_20_SFW_D_A]
MNWELGIGNWELGIGNWELGIGHWANRALGKQGIGKKARAGKNARAGHWNQ